MKIRTVLVTGASGKVGRSLVPALLDAGYQVHATESARRHLVQRAELWPWGSLWRWKQGSPQQKPPLSAWPLSRRPDWMQHVNRALTSRGIEGDPALRLAGESLRRRGVEP